VREELLSQLVTDFVTEFIKLVLATDFVTESAVAKFRSQIPSQTRTY